MTQATAKRKPTSRKRNAGAEAGRQYKKAMEDQPTGNKLEYLAKTLDAFGVLERIAKALNRTRTEGETLPADFLAYLVRLDRDDVKSVYFQEPFIDHSYRPHYANQRKKIYRHDEMKVFSIGWNDPRKPGFEKRFTIRVTYCEVERTDKND